MAQPRNDPRGDDFRRPGNSVQRASRLTHPFLRERSRIGRREIGPGGAKMPQPGKSVQIGLERRVTGASGKRGSGDLDDAACKRVATGIELPGHIGVGGPDVRRRGEDALGRGAGKAQRMKHADPGAPPQPPQDLAGQQPPQARIVDRGFGHARISFHLHRQNSRNGANANRQRRRLRRAAKKPSQPDTSGVSRCISSGRVRSQPSGVTKLSAPGISPDCKGSVS